MFHVHLIISLLVTWKSVFFFFSFDGHTDITEVYQDQSWHCDIAMDAFLIV